jgi:hypothetical protein
MEKRVQLLVEEKRVQLLAEKRELADKLLNELAGLAAKFVAELAGLAAKIDAELIGFGPGPARRLSYYLLAIRDARAALAEQDEPTLQAVPWAVRGGDFDPDGNALNE